jgi:membrane-associated phospholipid phosphatase
VALIPVYEWEISIARFFEGMPHDSALFEISNFISYPPKSVWVIYFAIIAILFAKFWPRINLLLVCSALAAGAGDLVSYRIVKMLFERPRPGSLISGCSEPSCWGFVSSHSTNIAALSTVLCLYDRRNIFWCLPLWIFVGGSRVVLGDHFALDVVFGGLLGVLVGLFSWYFLATLLSRTGSRIRLASNREDAA